MTCSKYGHKSKDLWHREVEYVPKNHYCDKTRHVKKEYGKITMEEKSSNNKKKYNNMKYND